MAAELNIHVKRLNIWINMHILCCCSRTELESSVRRQQAYNKNSFFFLLVFFALSLSLRQTASSLLPAAVENKKRTQKQAYSLMNLCEGFFPAQFTGRHLYWFLRPDKCTAKFSLCSHLEPYTSYLCRHNPCEHHGGSGLFVSIQLVSEIKSLNTPLCYLPPQDWFLNSYTFSSEY